MLSPTSLSSESTSLLHSRGLSNQQVDDFAALLQKASAQLDSETSAKQILSGLSASEMKLLQKAASLAGSINVNSLSNEGAMNLLAQPDKSDMVDLNNDGIVEVGAGRLVVFPPVNAPAGVKAAWDSATADISEQDKLSLELHMITANGITLGSHQPIVSSQSQEEQWSTAGWQKLLEKLRSSLEFYVSLDGWTRTNRVRQDFFNKFENELANMPQQIVAANTKTTRPQSSDSITLSNKAIKAANANPPPLEFYALPPWVGKYNFNVLSGFDLGKTDSERFAERSAQHPGYFAAPQSDRNEFHSLFRSHYLTVMKEAGITSAVERYQATILDTDFSESLHQRVQARVRDDVRFVSLMEQFGEELL